MSAALFFNLRKLTKFLSRDRGGPPQRIMLQCCSFHFHSLLNFGFFHQIFLTGCHALNNTRVPENEKNCFAIQGLTYSESHAWVSNSQSLRI